VREAARLAELLGVSLLGGGDLTFQRLANVGLRENPYRSERLRSELGWEPPYTQEEGLRRTAGWLREATS
jgi:nucleoside-diphosphate-sugar epimerase